ncbi:MAG TPA: hypothetical protein VE944_28185 [Nostoc sp.]|uniref:hypothetical protein n=1 Tax=Nostoc sp. TaxID=1180 RepID=UPI002D4D45A5|nr:hypothetical protein [Nostoc sp.]HYX18177.1 hypothetical protein [Nostoc sp.]
MNLEQLIDEVYGEHQAKLKAQLEAQKFQEQQEIEQAIAHFRSDFDAVISPNLQKELGINVRATYQHPVYVFAEFVYKDENLKIDRWCGDAWQVKRDDNYLTGGKPNVFMKCLLIELGKIRDSFEPKSIKVSATEMLSKFNSHYVEIEAIAQSEEWRNLCEVHHNDPEMKTHLGDVLHYLGESMGCVEEIKDVSNE